MTMIDGDEEFVAAQVEFERAVRNSKLFLSSFLAVMILDVIGLIWAIAAISGWPFFFFATCVYATFPFCWWLNSDCSRRLNKAFEEVRRLANLRKLTVR
jgi:hypothetical protein